MSKEIDWAKVESEFSGYYCSGNGRPGVPIRKMEGLMLLKNIYDLSDEEGVARWMENPYMLYFTGETVFQKRPPINPADFSKFRKRIGKKGAEKMFRLSLMVNAALLLPILLYYCCRFCRTDVTGFAAFLDAGYRWSSYMLTSLAAVSTRLPGQRRQEIIEVCGSLFIKGRRLQTVDSGLFC